MKESLKLQLQNHLTVHNYYSQREIVWENLQAIKDYINYNKDHYSYDPLVAYLSKLRHEQLCILIGLTSKIDKIESSLF